MKDCDQILNDFSTKCGGRNSEIASRSHLYLCTTGRINLLQFLKSSNFSQFRNLPFQQILYLILSSTILVVSSSLLQNLLHILLHIVTNIVTNRLTNLAFKFDSPFHFKKGERLTVETALDESQKRALKKDLEVGLAPMWVSDVEIVETLEFPKF
jgi:hypothetical protein